MNGSDIHTDVHRHLRSWQLRLLLQRLWVAAGISALLLAVFCLAGVSTTIIFVMLVLVLSVAFAMLLLGRKWKALNPLNFALHLNRRLPAFEESAQLLLQQPDQLAALQQLQRRRALAIYQQNLARFKAWQTPLHYRMWLFIILLSLTVALFAQPLRLISRQLILPAETTKSSSQAGADQDLLTQIKVSITPPAYTGHDSKLDDQLDLEVLEGSLIEWSLSFSGPITGGRDSQGYVIEFSDGKRIPLQVSTTGFWQAQLIASSTDLYRILAIHADGASNIGEVYALTVQLDQQPDIRIIEPANSTLEIPKSGPAVFNSEVLISDDFGIDNVGILASVAKGSGEGVKFRDQKLTFDQSTVADKGQIYQRRWNLETLGMEPGDEIYFSVLATDNKQPEANVARSATVIVRWLEDDKPGLAADGMAIDFIPEFFKSQRQIIIDTEQLIDDQANLAEQVFKDTSYEIGQAQADLKQKYGQFLGDEFGEGPGEQLGQAGVQAVSQHGDSEEGDGHGDDHADDGQAEAGDDSGSATTHAHAESGVTINTATNISDIVKLFGHDHGDPEIGKVYKQSPVALMKRAVSEMWAAERHLMQAEPALALPFEYEAYKYLKLARQADRIYVKRLGFEPPPVTEERRLTGDLKEIKSYKTTRSVDLQKLNKPRLEQRLLRKIWQLLSSQVSQGVIDADQDETLSQMSEQFRLWSQNRPALIKQAATIEKLRAAKQWQLLNCQECMAELKQSIWSLMDDGDALLHHPTQVYDSNDGLIETYLSERRQSAASTEAAAADRSQKPE